MRASFAICFIIFLANIKRISRHPMVPIFNLTRRVHGDRVTDFFKLCEIKVSLCSKKVTKAYAPLFRNTRENRDNKWEKIFERCNVLYLEANKRS